MGVKVIDNVATSTRIKQMFEERGLTAKAVQQALHLGSVQAVYKWIDSECKNLPSMDNIVLLAHFMDCAVEDILVLREGEL